MRPRPLTPTFALAAVLAGALAAVPARADEFFSGELQLRWDARSTNPRGPLARAQALAPGIAPPAPSAAVAEAELRGRWRSLAANALLWSEHDEGGGTRSGARINELHASVDLGAWQASAGRRIVGWDVGQGFRPNDVVQQEARRTLLSRTPQGRPLLQLEHFDADTATTLVWVNPQQVRERSGPVRGADESALALRHYRRDGAADWHGFARLGAHTGASLGAAVAWVATDEIELHASARWLQRHDGWQFDASAGNQPVRSNPWQAAMLGATGQGLLGGSWTGAQQQSLLLEWWHDGTALADRGWTAWNARNDALAQPGNLAWQATPFGAPNLRRDNLFARLAWQPGPWTLSLDALLHPADGGRVVTAALQWQGDRWRLNAAWRSYGGPAGSVVAQLPQRHTGVLAASWSF